MRIPKYIQELMQRSNFALGYGDPNYTIEIKKKTDRTFVDTLKADVERLEKWVNKNMPEDILGVPTIIINSIPEKTHYCEQYAVVTIYDPIMKHLEKYINEGI